MYCLDLEHDLSGIYRDITSVDFHHSHSFRLCPVAKVEHATNLVEHGPEQLRNCPQ